MNLASALSNNLIVYVFIAGDSGSSKRSSFIHLPPPLNLELTRQYVDNDTDCYCLFVCWEHPPKLPSNSVAYNVYVNNVLSDTIAMTAETSVLLSDIPRNQVSEPLIGLCHPNKNMLQNV